MSVPPGVMLLAFVLVPVLAGLTVGAVTGRSRKLREGTPPWGPRPWVFAVAWALLYAAMGAASFFVYVDAPTAAAARVALALYAVQLALNLAWTPTFVWASPRAALWVLGALGIAVLATTVAFGRASWAAGALMAPYLAWLGFAAAMNAAAAARQTEPYPSPAVSAVTVASLADWQRMLESPKEGQTYALKVPGNALQIPQSVGEMVMKNPQRVTIEGNGCKLVGAGFGQDGKPYSFTGLKVEGGKGVTVRNLAVSNFKKGVNFTRCENVVIENLSVANIGMEGLHLVSGKDYALRGVTTITDCGLLKTGMGESFYVGSSKSEDGPLSDVAVAGTLKIRGSDTEFIDIKKTTRNVTLTAALDFDLRGWLGMAPRGTGRVNGAAGMAVVGVKGPNCSMNPSAVTLSNAPSAFKGLYYVQSTASGTIIAGKSVPAAKSGSDIYDQRGTLVLRGVKD